MKNKIKNIKETVQIITLPNGFYNGIWGGYMIEVNYRDKIYNFETVEGVRGFGIKVVVEIKDGVATYDKINS